MHILRVIWRIAVGLLALAVLLRAQRTAGTDPFKGVVVCLLAMILLSVRGLMYWLEVSFAERKLLQASMYNDTMQALGKSDMALDLAPLREATKPSAGLVVNAITFAVLWLVATVGLIASVLAE